jgi:rhamnosyltransferase
MRKSARPKIAVLMATFNGVVWLPEQLSSIFACIGVDMHVFVSDDGSTDGTLEFLRQQSRDSVTILPFRKAGGAGQNFLRALLDAPWDDYDFVAFSDQDDIWVSGKLIRAVEQLEATGAQGYSSDVTAFWPNGRRRYVMKSQPQREWDYHFESGGPGNTFVLPTDEARRLRAKLKSKDSALLSQVALHDWLIYALVRSHSGQWIIDTYSGVDYRQHETNVIGVAGGPTAIRARFEMILSDWYRSQILAISEIAGQSNVVADYLRAPSLRRIWVPLWHMRKCRRRALEAALAASAFVFLAFRRRN